MNEVKTLVEITALVNTGHEIVCLSGVMQDGAEYLVLQDNTDQTCYSVRVPATEGGPPCLK